MTSWLFLKSRHACKESPPYFSVMHTIGPLAKMLGAALGTHVWRKSSSALNVKGACSCISFAFVAPFERRRFLLLFLVWHHCPNPAWQGVVDSATSVPTRRHKHALHVLCPDWRPAISIAQASPNPFYNLDTGMAREIDSSHWRHCTVMSG